MNAIYTSLWDSGLNPFDIYRDCVPNSENLRLQIEKFGLKPKGYEFLGPNELEMDEDESGIDDTEVGCYEFILDTF